MDELKPDFKNFANDILDAAWEGNDINGGFLQDVALKHGLLKLIEVTEPCDPDNCGCAEFGIFPQVCHRKNY